MASPKKKILFLCTGNSCRSQMAEGLACHVARGSWDAYSAGFKPAGVNPISVEIMKEIGIAIANKTSGAIYAKLLG